MSLLSKIGKIAGGIIGGPAGAAIGSAAGSLISGSGGKKAGNTAAAGEDAAAAERRAALTRVEGYQNPYRDYGNGAINALTALDAGDYSGFENSPDALFAQKYGAQAVDRSAAARGGLNSGNTLIAQQQFGQGLASQQLGAYRNALNARLGVGMGASNNLTDATLNTASGVAQNLVGAGDSRASGVAAKTNALAGGVEDLAGIAGDAFGNALIKKKAPAPVGAAYSPRARVGVY